MSSIPHFRSSHPKISSMPRKQSEATTHLEIYKLSVEKHRLEQELNNIQSREQQILKRLEEIEKQSNALMSKLNRVQTSTQADSPKKEKEKPSSISPKSGLEWQEVEVEY